MTERMRQFPDACQVQSLGSVRISEIRRSSLPLCVLRLKTGYKEASEDLTTGNLNRMLLEIITSMQVCAVQIHFSCTLTKSLPDTFLCYFFSDFASKYAPT